MVFCNKNEKLKSNLEEEEIMTAVKKNTMEN